MNQENAMPQVALHLQDGQGFGGQVPLEVPVAVQQVDPIAHYDYPGASIDPAMAQHIIAHPQPLLVECQPLSEPYTPTYDEIFPALPETVGQLPEPAQMVNPTQQLSYARKPKPSLITQLMRVAHENRKYTEVNSRFGEQMEQARICQDIMQKTGTQIECSSSKDGTLTFLIRGKEEAVFQAKKSISSELQTQASASLNIPKEHHRFILGKNGKKLMDLEANTGTKIHVPRQMDSSNSIKIIGPKESIERALHEIQLISNEAASRANERLSIEKEYHPFITGPFNELVAQIMSETGAKINIPPQSVQKNEISISGEKDAVAMARERIIKIYEEKKRNCQTVYVEVKKQQHRYVIGPKGHTLQDIFKKTGVSIEMPPSDNPSETITLRGEQEKLGPALTLLYEKVSPILHTIYGEHKGIEGTIVGVQEAHSEIDDELEAEHWIQKYIIGPKGSHFQELSVDFNSMVNVSFAANENKVKIHGPKKDVEFAKEVLDKEIRRIKSEITIGELKVDPKYHRFLIGKSGQTINQIRNKTGAQINIPSEQSEGLSSDVIRIEGSPEEVKGAKAELEAIISQRIKTDSNITKELMVEQRFHRQIIGSKGEKIREVRDKFNQVVITFPESNARSDKVAIRGPKEDVESCYKHLAQMNKDLLTSNFRAEVPIFKQFHKFVIGKDGANIRKIRDDTSTKIDLPAEDSSSDVIVITGKQENVEIARQRIQEFINELMSVVQMDIIIPAKFHNSIIGAKGRQIRSIMEECGGVLIKFPPENSGSDKVSIRGPKDCVAKAKQQLVELSNAKQVNSFSIEVKAKPEHHRYLIGKNGVNIKKVRENSGARIFFPTESETKEVDSDSETIVIMGKKEDVMKAKVALEEMIRDLEMVVESEMKVPPQFHKHFVARRGAILKQIADDFGGVLISFPRSNDRNSDRVVLKGSKECVETAKQRITEIVADLQAQVTVECVIEQQHHRAVMGSRGSNVQSIQTEHNVHIKFPERRANGVGQGQGPAPGAGGDEPEHVTNGDSHVSDDNASVSSEGKSPRKKCDVILVTGRQENCEAAKAALLASIPVEIEVQVPFDYHRFIIGQKGREVRELMDTYDVSINVPPSNEKSDNIRISGIKDNAERAKVAIGERVELLDKEKQDRLAKSFRETLHVDPSYHPKIIGKKGLVITKIRTTHDVQIQFPERGGAEGEAKDPSLIVVIGYEDNAKAAKKAILEIVGDIESTVTKEIQVDSRIHPRLIGAKGKTIREIMKKFDVDIRFPRAPESNPNLVVVSGKEENVEAVKDHLLNLEEEYLDDVVERTQYISPRNQSEGGSNRPKGEPNSGFFVKGGPWEQGGEGPQAVPDTNDTEEFPSMGSLGANQDLPSGRWGPKGGR